MWGHLWGSSREGPQCDRLVSSEDPRHLWVPGQTPPALPQLPQALLQRRSKGGAGALHGAACASQRLETVALPCTLLRPVPGVTLGGAEAGAQGAFRGGTRSPALTSPPGAGPLRAGRSQQPGRHPWSPPGQMPGKENAGGMPRSVTHHPVSQTRAGRMTSDGPRNSIGPGTAACRDGPCTSQGPSELPPGRTGHSGPCAATASTPPHPELPRCLSGAQSTMLFARTGEPTGGALMSHLGMQLCKTFVLWKPYFWELTRNDTLI